MTKSNKTLGSILLIISVTTTVNLFSVSMIGAKVGFLVAAFLLVAMWLLTTVTALLLLEVVLNFKEGANGFGSMAAKTLGKTGKVVVSVCFLSLFYAILAPYFSSVIALPGIKIYGFQLPRLFNAVFLTLVIGGIVFCGTRTVDLCNRGLIAIKGLCLLSILVFLLPKADIHMLPSVENSNFNWVLSLGTITALLLSSFKFHIYIPRLCDYLGAKPSKLKYCIIVGSVSSLIIALLLLLVGRSFFIAPITNKWFVWAVNGFYNIAFLTSFLLISLGLFDFIADSFRRKDSKFGKLQTILLTFIPPFILGWFYPWGFLWILKHAAFFTAILIVILPALMVYRLRTTSASRPYQVFGGKISLVVIMVLGGVLAVLPFLRIVTSFIADTKFN